MFKPKVSIIIPVYNGSNYLGEAIESAINQTYDNIEIIVVNDGSNDGGKTKQVAMKYKDKIRYFEKENGGVASALNFGIKKMEGEYFSWLSHDDMYYPDKIEEQIKFLENLDEEERNKAIVFTNFEFVDENGNFIYESGVSYMEPRQVLYKAIIGFPLNGCSLLIKKNFFEKVGYFDENLKHMQDYDMWFRLLKYYNFYMIDKVLVKSRRHNEQDSHKKAIIGIKDNIKLNKKIFEIFSISEIKESAGSNLPDFLFRIKLKSKLNFLIFLSYMTLFTKKLGIHRKLAPIARKIFFR